VTVTGEQLPDCGKADTMIEVPKTKREVDKPEKNFMVTKMGDTKS